MKKNAWDEYRAAMLNLQRVARAVIVQMKADQVKYAKGK